jgi:hypothetical protein
MIQTINETMNGSILDSVEFPMWDCVRKSIDYPVWESARDSMREVSVWNYIWGAIRELTEEVNNE